MARKTVRVSDISGQEIPDGKGVEEAEHFYHDVLGLEYKGCLGNSNMACVTVAEHSILLCQRQEPLVRTPEQDNRLHHSFTVSPEVFDKACKLFYAQGIRIAQPIVYREQGFFPGRELYFLDPSGSLNYAIPPGHQGCRNPPTRRLSGCKMRLGCFRLDRMAVTRGSLVCQF